MYVYVCVAEWSICTGLYGYKGGTYTPIDVRTPAPLWVFVGVFTCTHRHHPAAHTPPPQPTPLPHGPHRPHRGRSFGGSQSEPREAGTRGGAGTWGGEWAWLSGRGLRCPGSRGGVRRPKQTWRFIYIPPRLGQWAGALPACPAGGAVSWGGAQDGGGGGRRCRGGAVEPSAAGAAPCPARERAIALACVTPSRGILSPWEDVFFWQRRSGLSGASLRVFLWVRAAWALGACTGLRAPAEPVARGRLREGGGNSWGSGNLSRGGKVSKVPLWFRSLGCEMARSD